MRQYLELLADVRKNGATRKTRAVLKSTGQTVDALGVFGRQARFDLGSAFPIVTTKEIYWKGVVHELLWFLRGDTNTAYLEANKVTFWREWQRRGGDVGPIYGKQWRAWPDGKGGHIDQVKKVIEQIKRDPTSRRLVVSAWNVAQLDEMALPPCHAFFQFYVSDGKLSCQLYQRSADIFLGVPFNISSYALLTCMIAQVTGLRPGEFIHSFGDLHLYANHVEHADLQLSREPLPLPQLQLNPRVDDIDHFFFEDIALEGYRAHPKIEGEIAV